MLAIRRESRLFIFLPGADSLGDYGSMAGLWQMKVVFSPRNRYNEAS
jgi:hypothetical protein